MNRALTLVCLLAIIVAAAPRGGADEPSGRARTELTTLAAGGAGRMQSGPTEDGPGVRQPTFGRPVFVAPGAAFDAMVMLPEAAGAPLFELVCETDPPRRIVLATPQDASERLPIGAPLALRAPQDAAMGTYDLVVSWGGREVRARHCVSVGPVSDVVRLVHLSNMNLGDLDAARLDGRLIDEINLIGPTLVVATGDCLDALHPDRERGWAELIEDLCRLEAPVLMARGDHDDPELYGRFVAAAPVGEVRVGRFRGIVLDDTPRLPLTSASEQVRWVERLLDDRIGGQSFIVSHDEHPGLLAAWRTNGTLSRNLRAGRIGLWISGGHRDWDGIEYRGLVDAAAPLVYVRTHQASASQRDGATGTPHYRVIDLLPDRVEMPGEPSANGAPPGSMAVGLLEAHVERDPADDGVLVLHAVNRHPFSLRGLRRRVLLPYAGEARPWCQGALLESAARRGAVWECTLRFDLPDKGVLRARVGVGPTPTDSPPRITFDLPSELVVSPKRSGDGVTYYEAALERAIVTIHNPGGELLEIEPLIRLDGDRIGYRPADREMPYVTTCRLRLGPGQSAALRLDFSAIRLRPGRRELQAYALGLPTLIPQTHALWVRERRER